MIYESHPWRVQLYKDAQLLERRSKKDLTEHGFFLFEQKIFLAAYAIRKLGDSYKLPDSFLTQQFKIYRYKARPKKYPLSPQARHYLNENYYLWNREAISIPVKTLVNFIIHSFSFALDWNRTDVVTAFFVNSDHHKDKYLYRVPLKKFIKLMKDVKQAYPTSSRHSYDIASREWVMEQE